MPWYYAEYAKRASDHRAADEQSDVLYQLVDYFGMCVYGSGQKSSFRAKPKQWGQAMLMGTAGMLLTALLLNFSYMYLPVGMSIMLNFLYPTIVCVVMGTVFRQGFTRLQIMAIAASVTGMIFLAGGGGAFKVIGIVAALVSAFTYGGYLIANEIDRQMTFRWKLSFFMYPFRVPCFIRFLHLQRVPLRCLRAGRLDGYVSLVRDFLHPAAIFS